MKPPLLLLCLACAAWTALGATPQAPAAAASQPADEEPLVVPVAPLFPQPEPPAALSDTTASPPAPEAEQVEPAIEDESDTATARFIAALLIGARESIRRAPAYDNSYRLLDYPGGDPGWAVGSGTDVIIRAFRHAGIDLQQQVHEDILAAGAAYGIVAPNSHIDHRRVINLATFFRRHGQSLSFGPDAEWQPGDLVFWADEEETRPTGVGIVTGERNAQGHPLVIHHAPTSTPRAADVLFDRPVWGHFRWAPPAG